MKKIFYSATLFVATLFAFNACAPEDPAEAVNVNEVFQKTTLKGYAYLSVNTNTTATGDAVKVAPAGTVLSFSIFYSDLGIPNAVGNYVTTCTIEGAEGAYEVELPVREDGQSVTVAIKAQTVEQPISTVNGNAGTVKEVQLYDAFGTVQISKGLPAIKKLTFGYNDAIGKEDQWIDATYIAKLVYNNGKGDDVVPAGTEVVLTINGGYFYPRRDNNLTYITTVGADGELKVILKAPSLALAPEGLPFTLTSAFIADKFTYTAGTELSELYTYTLNSSSGKLFGGETVNAGTAVKYIYGTSVALAAKDKTWKPVTYTVKFLYDNDDFDDYNDYVGIPTDANITITLWKSSLYSELSDIVIAKNYGNTGVLEFTVNAPDPALEPNPLQFTIDVNFIVEKKDGEISGTAIKNTYRYSWQVSDKLLGGINKKGGIDFTQPTSGDIVENVIELPTWSATKLTSN